MIFLYLNKSSAEILYFKQNSYKKEVWINVIPFSYSDITDCVVFNIVANWDCVIELFNLSFFKLIPNLDLLILIASDKSV